MSESSNQSLNRDKYCYGFRDLFDVLKQEKVISSDIESMEKIQDFLLELRSKTIKELDKDQYNQGYKIPPILHIIWFTSEDNPREINDYNLNKILRNKEILELSDQPWSFVLWTDNQTLFPKTAKTLQDAGFIVKNLDELDFNSPVIKDNLINAIEKKHYGMASDYLRYVILQNYGGLYVDVDQLFFKKIDKLMQTYDLFSNLEAAEFDFISSGIIGAKRNHTVIDEALKAIERNIVIEDSSPEYAKYPCNIFEQSVLSTGPGMWTATFYNYANQNDNKDIVFDRHVLCGGKQQKDNDPKDENYNSENIPDIGSQENNTTWLKDGDGDLIMY